MAQQVGLLHLQHLHVFAKYLALALADLRGQARVLGFELACHAPVVPVRGLGFGGDEVHHHAGGFGMGWRVKAAHARQGHAHIDHHVAGWGEAADLPAVHRRLGVEPIGFHGHAPKRWRLDVVHVTAGHYGVALFVGGARGVVDLGLTNAAGVHIGLVGQVHQVVDHQPVIGFDVVEASRIGPAGVVKEVKHGHQAGVGQGGVARPHPHEPIALDHCICADAGKALYPLAGHVHGFAFAAHFQAVVAADQFAVLHPAQRQRGTAVRAKVLDRHGLLFGIAKKHHALVANGAAQGLVAEVCAGAGHVPGVHQKHVNAFHSAY